jgi:hypothetical protein
MASPLTALATANGGRVSGVGSGTYATAYGSGESTSSSLFTGQLYAGAVYYLDQTFLEFDTSGIGAGQVVTGVTLSLYGVQNDDIGTAFVLQARTYDFGASVTTADWRTPSQFSALTLLASLSVPTGYGNAAYYDFTSETAFLAAVNMAGMTRIVLESSRYAAATAPTGVERHLWEAIGVANKAPKLVVTYTATGAPVQIMRTRIIPSFLGGL